MSKVKKIVSACLIAIMISILFPSGSLATDDGKLHFSLVSSAEEVYAGEEFVMTIYLDANPGVAGFAMFLRYDTDKFEILGNDGSDSCFPGYIGTEVDSSAQFAWLDLGIILHGDNHSTGKLLDVTLRAKDGATGAGDFYIDVYTAANFDEQVIYAESTTISVSVKDVIPGDVNLDNAVDARDATQILRYINENNSIMAEEEDPLANIRLRAGDVDEDSLITDADAATILSTVTRRER